MHCNGLKLSGVLEEFSITSLFLGSKMQKTDFLKKIGVLSAIFQIRLQVFANLPSQLEKHQTHDILLVTDFL